MRFTVEITNRPLAVFLALLFLSFFYPQNTSSDTLSLTTYLPAPIGVFDKLDAKGQTFLASKTGNVGIGTTNPLYKLDVSGNIYTETAKLDTGDQPIPTLSAGSNVTVTNNGNNTWTISGACP